MAKVKRLNATLKAVATWVYWNTSEYGPTKNEGTRTVKANVVNGQSGANVSDTLYRKRLTVEQGTPLDLDLTALEDVFGLTKPFEHVAGVLIHNRSTTSQQHMLVGPQGVANGWTTPFDGDADGKAVCNAGGHVSLASPVDRLSVTDSNKVLRVTHDGAAAADIEVDVVIFGVQEQSSSSASSSSSSTSSSSSSSSQSTSSSSSTTSSSQSSSSSSSSSRSSSSSPSTVVETSASQTSVSESSESFSVSSGSSESQSSESESTIHPLLDDMVAYWKLEEASGTRVDAHTGGHDLTALNSPGRAAAKIDYGVDFGGYLANQNLSSADAELKLPNAGDSDFTVAGWASLADKTANRAIASRWDTADFSWSLIYEAAGNRFFGLYGADGTNTTAVIVAEDPAQDEQFFWCVRVNDAGITVRINTTEQTGSNGSFLPIHHGSAPFVLGSILNGGAPNTEHDGTVDEVGVWAKRLTDAEVDQLYNSGDGLQYPFDG